MKKIKILIVLLLAFVMVASACQPKVNTGEQARAQIAVSTEHYQVDGMMMSYFYSEYFADICQYWYDVYSKFYGNQMTTDLVYQAMGLEMPDKDHKEQYMTIQGKESVTVFDYYMELTEEYVTQILTYCEFAHDSGIALTDEDHQRIDRELQQLKEEYESTKQMYAAFGLSYYKTYEEHLAACYGSGTNESDVRRCMELITLADKYEQYLAAELENNLTMDELEAYVSANYESFMLADYYACSFTVDNKGKSDAAFEQDMAQTLERAKALASVSDPSDFRAGALEVLKEAELKAYRDQEWQKILDANGGDAEKAEQELLEVFDATVWTEEIQNEKFAATLTRGYAPIEGRDLSSWIFGTKEEGYKNGAHKGDLTYIASITDKEETVGGQNKIKVRSYTVTVYMLEAEPYRNAEKTKLFGYVLFEDKMDADAFYAAFREKDRNRDTLVELVEETKDRLSVYAYESFEDYLLGDLSAPKEERDTASLAGVTGDTITVTLDSLSKTWIEGVDEWLEKALPGHCSGVLEVTRVSTNLFDPRKIETRTVYYAVMIYDGEGYEYWYQKALEGATAAVMEEWIGQNALDLTYDEQAYAYIQTGTFN